MKTLDEMTAAYIHAALWSTSDGDLESLEGFDLAPGEYEKARADCERFLKVAGNLLLSREPLSLERLWTNEQAGHDLWLTRNGHGAGFWGRYIDFTDYQDREDAKVNGEKLTALVGYHTDFQPLDLYIDDEGLVRGF
jgi:hypothetical protein